MSEAKHTPGPWLIHGNTVYALMHHGWRKGIELFKNRFSVQFSFDSSCSKEEIESTKQLIAAAPDLLEALVQFVDEFDGCYADGEPAMINARAAIAKATKVQP
jgi:hypothetical protein